MSFGLHTLRRQHGANIAVLHRRKSRREFCEVVGNFLIGPEGSYLYSSGMSMDLGPVNAHGEIVGSFGRLTADGGAEHAFLLSDGALTDIGKLAPGGVGRSFARSINNNGQVAGFCQLDS